MDIVVKCPGCGLSLGVPAEARGQQVRCMGCNHVFEVPAEVAAPLEPAQQVTTPGPSIPTGSSTPTGPPPPPAPGMQGPFLPTQPIYGDNVYEPHFDLQIVDPSRRAYWLSWRPEAFSPAGAVVLDIITCGLFSLIYYGLKFSELPKASRDDFRAGKAIGFMFIPYYDFYWVFRFWGGLCDRMNLQLRLRGMNHLLLSRGMTTTICVLHICASIPYLGLLALLPLIVCREIFIGNLQSAINTMAAPTMAMPGQEASACQ